MALPKMSEQNLQKQFQELIEKFVMSVMTHLDLPKMTSEREKSLRTVMMQKMDQRIMTLIVDELSDSDFEEAMKKFENGEMNEEGQQMIFVQASARIPNFPQKFTKALEDLATEMIQDSADLKKIISE